MDLEIGTSVGPHRIDARLGAGGMGVVYAAYDVRLQRAVAIKFLSDDLADTAARRRFQREAQTASSLNHPHILSVYDTGEHQGSQYLVTEFVDGGTLRDWARDSKPGWRQIVELLAGIADGIAAAHGAGILHRDVKPENILVNRAGHAKLADFGLAKLMEPASSDQTTRTIVGESTRPGVIVGTISYMSPEQASGRAVDSRSDIFSLGVVLYELVSGSRPFRGATDLETLQAVIHQPAAPLAGDVPPRLRAVVEKALEKDPNDRYQTARDLVVDLRRALRQESTMSTPAAAPFRRTARTRIWLLAAGLVLVALALGYGYLARSDYFWRNPLEGARFEKLTDWPGTELDAGISLDGKFVAFLADRDGPYDTWVTQLGSGEFRNLTQGRSLTLLHENTRTTGFSADGAQVWLRTSPTISLVPTMGGAMRVFLATAGKTVLNSIWSPDGKHLAFHYADAGDPIMVSDADGRNAKQIFAARPGEHNHFLAWSPDQRFLYFARGFRSTEMDIWRVPSEGGAPEQITRHNSHVAYPALLDNRTLLYRATTGDGSGWSLYGMDVERRTAHQISLGVEEYQSIAASADGRRIVATVSNPIVSLWKVPIADRIMEESDAARIVVPTAHAKGGRYGRGYMLFLSGKGGESGLWKLKDGAAAELWKGSAGAVTTAPALSPDGNSIALSIKQRGRSTLYVTTADGVDARPLAQSLDLRSSPSWSPDGKWIAVAADTGDGSRIYKVPIAGGNPEQLTNQLSFWPAWSPDGQLILYNDASMGTSLYPIRAVRPDGTAVPIPEFRQLGDFESFRFAPDGSVIILAGSQGPIPAGITAFRTLDFWSMDLKTGKARRLTQLKPGYSVRSFDVSADGREILFDRVLENSDIVLIDRP